MINTLGISELISASFAGANRELSMHAERLSIGHSETNSAALACNRFG